MNSITFMQTVELIDIAAKEDRLWHYNGGQAYIRVNNNSNVLMIIDHTLQDNNYVGIPSVTLNDGAEYFKSYAGAQFEYSRRLRDDSRGPIVEFFSNRFTDVLPLETV
jgi:hypothetical protein